MALAKYATSPTNLRNDDIRGAPASRQWCDRGRRGAAQACRREVARPASDHGHSAAQDGGTQSAVPTIAGADGRMFGVTGQGPGAKGAAGGIDRAQRMMPATDQ